MNYYEIDFKINLHENCISYTFDLYGNKIKDLKNIDTKTALALNQCAVTEILNSNEKYLSEILSKENNIDNETNIHLH